VLHRAVRVLLPALESVFWTVDQVDAWQARAGRTHLVGSMAFDAAEEQRHVMLVMRFIASLFLLGAVIALTADISRPGRADAPRFASIERHWADLAPQSLAGAQKVVRSRVHPVVWDPMIRSVIGVPAFLMLGGLAGAFFYLGRPRRRVEIFVN
jgi:hypothetical protein